MSVRALIIADRYVDAAKWAYEAGIPDQVWCYVYGLQDIAGHRADSVVVVSLSLRAEMNLDEDTWNHLQMLRAEGVSEWRPR